MKKRILFDGIMISRMITRIANEIIEQNKLDDIVLVGIQTRETLDIKFYRYDLEKIS